MCTWRTNPRTGRRFMVSECPKCAADRRREVEERMRRAGLNPKMKFLTPEERAARDYEAEHREEDEEE